MSDAAEQEFRNAIVCLAIAVEESVWKDVNAKAEVLLVHHAALEQEVARLRALQASLFEAIRHGDEKHQRWLKDKIDAHFNLHEREVPDDFLIKWMKGDGSNEREETP